MTQSEFAKLVSPFAPTFLYADRTGKYYLTQHGHDIDFASEIEARRYGWRHGLWVQVIE